MWQTGDTEKPEHETARQQDKITQNIGTSRISPDTTLALTFTLSLEDKVHLTRYFKPEGELVCLLWRHRLFTEYPEMQNFFSAFKGMDAATLRKDRTMYSHSLTVMYSFASLVDNLDDADQLALLVQKIAHNHVARDVGFKYFEVSVVPTVEYQ